LKMPRPELERMLAHVRTGYPFEACGALLGRDHEVVRVAPLENRETEKPSVRYAIDPKDLVRLDRESREVGLEIIGYFHSHPDHPARPSETDRQRAAATLSNGVFHVVVGLEGRESATPTAWVFKDATQSFEPEPLDIA
jgi:proteasome lid subunit RPN8/RPN11